MSTNNDLALLDEIARLNKIINVLMDRAEQSINEGSDFSYLQTTIALEDKVLRRTEELHDALDKLAQSNEELDLSLKALHETQQHLIESEKMAALGALVAGVAHEINTPIGIALTTNSHINNETSQIRNALKTSTMTKTRFEDYLNEVDDGCNLSLRNLERASDLIKRFKQVATHQNDLNRQCVDVVEVVKDICSTMSHTLKDKQITLAIEGQGPIIANTYPGAISQIITNLVANSAQHAFTEKGSHNIQISIQRTQTDISLLCADNGRGVPRDIIKHIFEPFYTTRRGSGGTGLGLHIAYNLATEVLEGDIQCSLPNEGGTLFTVKFPYSEAE